MYLKRVQGCTFNSSLIECMKLYKSLFFVAALFVILNSSAQDLSFEEYNPKSTLVVPGGIIKKAKFSFYRCARTSVQNVKSRSVASNFGNGYIEHGDHGKPERPFRLES